MRTVTCKKPVFADLPEDYAGLVAFYPLRPLHDKVDFNNAYEVAMAMAGHSLTVDQEDYLAVLTTLINQYDEERNTQPLPDTDALGMLKFLMEQHGMNASDLGRLLGQRELGSKIFREDRELSKAHIRKLAEHFHVSPAMFM